MCGLFGIAGAGITQGDLTIFKELGHVSQFRGRDGAGVFEVNSRNKNDVGAVLKLSEDFNFWVDYNDSNPKKEKLLESVANDLIMGHTRFATTGKINDASCHPFVFNNLVGMHNGTLYLPKYKVDGKVDSELMFAEISQRGFRSVLVELTDKCAYAITAFDKVARQFIFALNGLRSLHFAVNKKRDVLYWASERSALEYVLVGRHAQDVFFFSLAPGVWTTTTAKIRHNNPAIFSGWTLESARPKPEPKPESTGVKLKGNGNIIRLPASKDVPKTAQEIRLEEAMNKLFKDEAPAKKEDRVPWKMPLEGSFGRLAACCGKPISPMEAWDMRNEYNEGYHDEDRDEYIHYACLQPATKTAQ